MPDLPEREEPMSLVEREESTLAGRLGMARARYEAALIAVHEAEQEGRDIHAQQPRRKRPTRGEEDTRLELALRMHQVQLERANRLDAQRSAALAEAAKWTVGWDQETDPSPEYLLLGSVWREAARRLRIALGATAE